MSKILLKKIGAVIFIMIILRIALVVCLDYINVHSSNYIKTQNEKITINEKLDDHLYSIIDNQANNDEKNVFYIRSDRKQNFSILLDNLTFPHEIYINNKVVSQNIDENDINYDSDYAYKIFQLVTSDYIENTIKISITGSKADQAELFLAKGDILKDCREIRTIIHVVFLVFLIIGTLITLILYFYNKSEYYFLIFFFMGIISIVKTVVLGELFVLSQFLGITVHNYSYIDIATNIINTVIPIFIVCYLFDFKIKPKYFFMIMSTVFLLGFFILKDGGNSSLYSMILLIALIVGNAIIIWAYIKDKPYSKVIMLNAVVYSSCAIYYLLVFKGIFLSGSVLFFMNTAYFGAVIYIGGFLLAILLKHLDKVRALENNKKEYERVLLLRGISHDLKLPLSVIKLNNQIIEKYDLPADEIKDYAQTNLEATLELEKMTENINSYLSLKQISAAGETTSVKNCFEKMKHYYNFYNRYDNYKFTVKCADKDCTLDINPLHFSRMLYNLVDNAFKYNKNGVQVTASYKVDKELLISIEDNGIGMDKEEIDKVFEPFYRIDESRTNGGLGLGLSVVKEVIESLKGTIEIESEKGVGTKIIITIPFY